MRTFEFRSRVYFSDTDAGGIVYHARYLDYAEHARTEMLREILPELSQSGLKQENLIFVVKSISIDYRRPGYLDDEIKVVTSLEKAERFSAIFNQKVLRGEEELCVLSVRVASVTADTKRLCPLPDAVVEALR